MGAHARFGGSSAYRWTACPGSIQACEVLPKRSGGPAADRGTLFHNIMEVIPQLYFLWQAEMLLDDYLEEFVGVQLDSEVKFLKSDIPTIKHAVELTAAITSIFINEYDRPQFYREIRCEILPDMWGTADLVIIAGERGLVLDYKFGQVPVPTINNWQGLFYALGASKRFPEVKNWSFAIVQPHTQPSTMDAEELDALVWDIAPGLMKLAERKFLTSRDDAVSEEPSRAAGAHCQYCAAKSLCAEFKEKFVDRSRILDSSNLAVLQYGLELVSSVEAWCAEVRANAKEASSKGASFSGWKMVNGGKEYEYIDLDKAAEHISSVPWPIEREVLLSPAKIKKFFPELFEIMVEDGTIMEKAKPMRFVPDKEPGRAVNPSILAMTNLTKLM